MKNDKNNKTFPFIETLIVIAIIILCAIRILSLNAMTTDTTTNVSQTLALKPSFVKANVSACH